MSQTCLQIGEEKPDFTYLWMGKAPMRIDRVVRDKKRYIDLLLLADEQESMIDRYLMRSQMYVLLWKGEACACVAVTNEGDGVLEIKNLAVCPRYQHMGFGRTMIEFIRHVYAGRFRVLRVGTGDSPATVPFYERCGFVRTGCIPDFFTENYDHPIVEGGVLLRDMVIYSMNL